MTRRGIGVFLVAAVLGAGLALKKPRVPAHASFVSTDHSGLHDHRLVPPSGHAVPWMRAREFQVVDGNGRELVRLTNGPEGPGLWMNDSGKRGGIQAGIHANGFPAVLVTDAAIHNFGLGRVDGKNASPLLIFRANDEVRLLMGLSMTEPGSPAFLAHWPTLDKKVLSFGQY